MSLESLVPPLTLCRQLQPGDFPESAFCWAQRRVVVNTEEGWVDQKEEKRIVLMLTRDVCQSDIVCMAPTSDEIYLSIFQSRIDVAFVSMTMWMIGICEISAQYGSVEIKEQFKKNPATAALRLWMKVNGREVKG